MALETFHWKPLEYLDPESDKKIVLIVLNTPLENIPRFKKLWQKAIFKVCADGATNELHNFNKSHNEDFMPDLITGDFDSAEPDVLQKFREKGSEILDTPDQDHTDFTKCLKLVVKRIKTQKIPVDHIVVYVGFTGRFDHIIGNLNTLYLAREWTSLPVYLLSGDAIALLLSKGKHVLNVSSGFEGKWCGLMPIGAPCHCVTSSGLKWNLDKSCLKFGALVSTSNKLDGSGEVNIETDSELIWSMGVLT